MATKAFTVVGAAVKTNISIEVATAMAADAIVVGAVKTKAQLTQFFLSRCCCVGHLLAEDRVGKAARKSRTAARRQVLPPTTL